MAINEGVSDDPTRGSGAGKATEAVSPDLDASPNDQDESTSPGEPDPARGGCMKYGWGCLPAIAGLMLLPASIFF